MEPNSIVNLTQWGNETGEALRSSQLEEDGGRADGQVITACVSAAVVILVLSGCGLLCYREVSRRREELGFMSNIMRRETIRKTVQLRIQQLEMARMDSSSYLERMEMKVPLVTFGEVIMISPAHSPWPSNEALNHWHDDNSDGYCKHPLDGEAHLSTSGRISRTSINSQQLQRHFAPNLSLQLSHQHLQWPQSRIHQPHPSQTTQHDHRHQHHHHHHEQQQNLPTIICIETEQE